MFRRRSELVKKLWKYWRGAHQAVEVYHYHKSSIEELESESRAILYSVLKRLSDSNLKILVDSLESGGKKKTDCGLFSSEEIHLGRHGTFQLHKYLCKAFRWSDLAKFESVKAVWVCQSSHQDSKLYCCNPYHYSRVVPQECSLPPYSPIVQSEFPTTNTTKDYESMTKSSGQKPLPISKDLCHSTRTTWSKPSPMPCDIWCQVAYWEMVTRVGHLFQVQDNPVNVFSESPQEDGLCLGLLGNESRTQLTERVRNHIGSGFQVTKEGDGVWLYNRSDNTLFASSSTLQLVGVEYDAPTVKRVPSGSSLLVFDFSRLSELQECAKHINSSDNGPCDLFCIRISFAKGWGLTFSRQYITSCPCWLEIHLNDTILPSLPPP